ncbi:alpha-amylase family glycosyl hydrolase [Flavisolibacter nicotianae]|uniref:alpha-amylase family glycosyl hydrolase n=1 Tax=Flavisolibacter nicotianae TaxID=2364882 RepID=UPI000EB29AA6|nr:alpha-amylase family glycosyl hydrolase [Flavisolibacter nicotianae]
MQTKTVTFRFVTGLKRPIFRNARLLGSWDATGHFTDVWTESPMTEITGEDGCPVFTASVSLDLADSHHTFRWGVLLDGPQGSNFWGIPTELQDVNSTERFRQFRLQSGNEGQEETYYFTWLRRLGANKHSATAGAAPLVRFAVWAPNARKVEVVFGDPSNGYIDDNGGGIDPARSVLPLAANDAGIWAGVLRENFASCLGVPYMYRIENAQGKTVYRTDIFSRSQIGKGAFNPGGNAYPGTPDQLDGTVSCSVVIDPDVVRSTFSSVPAGTVPPNLVPAEDFWATEFTAGLPVPTGLEDLVIYELHVGSLGFGKAGPGNLADALAFLDHLVDLGINAIELLPMAEFSGNVAWGYGDSHHLCIEASAGGRDQYRHFVRECHRRGIAVIQDVVYNHYDPGAERAQWQYDSTVPEQNIYYWYEGRSTDYTFAEGGYLDNGSSGFTPRFWEETVRQQFISAAAFLVEEMHVDGLRVDLTQALHRDNALHADGRSVGAANVFGQKFLREWSRTLKMIKPSVLLIAEDHTEWDAVTKPPAQGGLGFDARWEAAYYHHLVGDSDMAGGKARLLKQAGFGGDDPLPMDSFSAALYNTQYRQVVFHESHDEAGNAGGTARTLVTAVNHAAIFGATRIAAESRSRVCFGLTLLSAGTPMFFMGEEIGAQQPYRFNSFLAHREDITGERIANGGALFHFYQDLITLSRRLSCIRSRNIDIVHQSNQNRVIAFKRWSGQEEVIVVASLNNRPFDNGYVIAKDAAAIPGGGWKEIFNSDAALYGGQNTGNAGAVIAAWPGQLSLVIPANGFVVLVRQ